jgi:hypothetical protein
MTLVASQALAEKAQWWCFAQYCSVLFGQLWACASVPSFACLLSECVCNAHKQITQLSVFQTTAMRSAFHLDPCLWPSPFQLRFDKPFVLHTHTR